MSVAALAERPETAAAPPRLKVLAPTRYLWTFNGPRQSRHQVERREFLALNRLPVTRQWEGVTIFSPTLTRFDLIHAFNRIPLSGTPFVIGFESHLPRSFGLEDSAYHRWLVRRLASPQCRAIVPISRRAERIFLDQHKDSPLLPALRRKTQVRYPNMVVPDVEDTLAAGDGPLTVTFVGSHFARKGGCVAVRLAELALAAGAPIRVEIVSGLQMGACSWTDPLRLEFFEPYVKLLSLPNVTAHQRLDNAEVLRLLRRSHFSLLTTFSDTFGFSAIESMMNYCPVIATRQGALPEFIADGENGILLELETDGFAEWVHSSSEERGTPAFEAIFAAEVDRLAAATLARLLALHGDPAAYWAMRRQARATAARMFDAAEAGRFWDALYDRAVGGPVEG